MSADALDQLGEIDQADVVRCARVLLRRPLLRVGGQDGELLPLVHRHRAVLIDLFAGLLGYRLVVERRFARLYKTGPGQDPTRGEPTLTPRGYAYLALALAALTTVGQQTLLSRLVTDIRAAGTQAGVAVSDDLSDLRAIASALRHLVAIGVLTETEGTVSTESSAEALLTVDTTLLGQLVAGPIGTATTATELVGLAARPGPRGVEHVVRRRLVENPVTHYADLTDEQAAWLRRRARAEARLLERCFGLVTETRLEGVAVTDPQDYLTDLSFPGQSTVARIALLALPELLSGQADERGWVAVTVERVAAVCAELFEAYPAAWSKQTSVPRLVDDVLHLLAALGLARRGEDGWLLSPAAHRWQPSADATPRQGEPEEAPEPVERWSLFDEGVPT
ncbi:TIGR02678 family protein [Actinophytocola xinjiangensis]|uniref:TIGR02678 family protein n=1 Tax=Actinophytocola xinjiangensis TaxID=485602 RepID=A0A7Z1AU46_9PSEU|nr:TIGR02678 family protein [Actinophytocola xinjiangensis]OLF05564.1 TIGR02678 family protein [Actinophytocola xinjiangensis]